MPGKSKKAKESEEFDALLKELKTTTRDAGSKKAKASKGQAKALTKTELAAAHKERHDAIEKAKEAQLTGMLEQQQQQRMIQKIMEQMQMGGGMGGMGFSPYLQAPNTDFKDEVKKNASFDVATGSMQGWRKEMEDAHVSDLEFGAKTGLFAVFDGHAGSKASLGASKTLPLAVRMAQDKDGKVDWVKAYAQLDSSLKSKLTDGSGSTACTVLVTPDSITCANVGDSRAVLSRGGETIALSEDHKPDSAEEKARIEAAGGHVENNRVDGGLAMSRAIGDFMYKGNDDLPADKQKVISVPDVVTKKREKSDDFVIVACDGIWDVMANDQAVEFVAKGIADKKDLVTIAKEMCDFCLAPAADKAPARPLGTDNMTVTIVKLQ